MRQIETITERITSDILSGKLGQYSALPTRRAMAEQFGTTVDTIAKVLHNLEVAGLVVKGRGRTMKVNTPRERVTSNSERFVDVMEQKGNQIEVEYLQTPGIVSAGPDLARWFKVSPETKVVERIRREIVNGSVYRYSRKIYLANLVPVDVLEAMQADHTYNVRQIIEAHRPLSRIEERLFARVITSKEEAEILRTVKGAPVLENWKINYDQEKRVAWISIVIHNAIYFEKRYDYSPGDEPKPSDFLAQENIS